ncbi:MAG: uroporphyrinogen decarboxylase family protein [Dehalococcoidia bacterium]|nr:uroporphyrinogen decarboxylase family protein [Dehalococcoidia bacterium]
MKAAKDTAQDKMTPEDRVTALLSGRRPDRVPFFPLGIRGFATINVGYGLAAAYSDGARSCWAQLRTQEQYGFEGFPFYSYGAYGAWEFGGEIKFPSSEWQQAPSAVRFPAETEEDAWKLGLPDVKTAGAIPIAMELSKAAEEAGVWVTTPTAGVFTTAGNICGIQKLCRWMLRKPEVVHRLLRLATDYIIEVTRYWVDIFGPDIVAFTAEPSAANQIISPRHFEEFVLPYTKEFHEKILATGIRHIMCHICGEQNLNLPYWAQIPMGNPGIVTFGHEVDLTTAIEYFGDSCVIAGNVDGSVIQSGTHEQVYELCRVAIEKGKKAPRGFILMSGCGYPPKAPPYNLYTMAKAVNDLGCYD